MTGPAGSLPAVVFDHVALALPDRAPFLDLFARDLGGEWVGSADTLGGFSFSQVRYANGMKVEALEPLAPGDDFLVRFLAARGPGPHHLTFKVPDLLVAVDAARRLGYEPLGVSVDDDRWHEAFLHPREAAGIVVQLAWSAGQLHKPRPEWLPAPRVPAAAELVHVALAVADLEGALQLFKGLLGGRSVDAGAGGGLGFVDVAFAEPEGARAGGTGGQLRLLAGGPVGSWVGERPGRLHSLCFRVDEPGGVAGAVAHPGWWELAAGPPLGTRLVLIEPGAPVPMKP